MNRPRRSFLKSMTTAITTVAIPASAFAEGGSPIEPIQLGIIADTHIGFVDDAEQRFDAFMQDMAKVSPDGLIQLGDFAYPNQKLQRFADALNAGAETTIHTIGNHDLDHSLTREDCMKAWGIPSPYYSRMIKDLQVIVLDGNESGSPTHELHGGYPSYIGPQQQDWLANELQSSKSPVLIVSHQPLAGRSAIDNAKELQAILSRHKEKVILCLNGHSHVDQQIDIDGITYLHCNSAAYFWLGGKSRLAKYEDPLYATMTIDPVSRKITIEGVQSKWRSNTPEDAGFFTGKPADLEKIVVPKIRNRTLRYHSQS